MLRNSEDLRRFLKHVGWSGLEADRRAGVPVGRTASYLADRSKPSMEYCDALAKESGLGTSWRDIDIPESAATTGPASAPPNPELPLIGALPDARFGPVVGRSAQSVTVPAHLATAGRFAAKIRGGSFHPALFQGDLVIAELDDTPAAGTVILARTPAGEAVLRVLRLREGIPFLAAVNDPTGAELNPDAEVVARVVAIIRLVDGAQMVIENPSGLTQRQVVLSSLRGESAV